MSQFTAIDFKSRPQQIGASPYFLIALVFLAFIGYVDTATANTLLIKNVTIIDATGSAPQPHKNVIVRDGVIDSIRSIDDTTVLPSAKTIDASGMFLVPGFWDMHVHATSEFLLPPLGRVPSA